MAHNHHSSSSSSSLFFERRKRKKHHRHYPLSHYITTTDPSMAKSKKKKTLTSLLFKPTHFLYCYTSPLATWPWPSCKHPRTNSFRNNHVSDSVYKTVNTVYDAISVESTVDRSSSTVDLRSLRSDRLLFDPAGSSSSSILQKSPRKNKKQGKDKEKDMGPFKESIVLTVDSSDPYKDFRESMQEMVRAHGIKDWEGLEKLLGMYLRLNVKKTHGLIVGAFVDLLVAMAANSGGSPSSCSCITFDEIGEVVEQFG